MKIYKPLFYNFDPNDEWDQLTQSLFEYTNEQSNYTQIVAVYSTEFTYSIFYTYYSSDGQPSNSVWMAITRKTNIRDIRDHVLKTNRSLQTYPAFNETFPIDDNSNLNNRLTRQINKAILSCDNMANLTETIELMMI